MSRHRRWRRLNCEQNVGGDGPEDRHDGRAMEVDSLLPCKRCSARTGATQTHRRAEKKRGEMRAGALRGKSGRIGGRMGGREDGERKK